MHERDGNLQEVTKSDNSRIDSMADSKDLSDTLAA
jgi:hypothetical protein